MWKCGNITAESEKRSREITILEVCSAALRRSGYFIFNEINKYSNYRN